MLKFQINLHLQRIGPDLALYKRHSYSLVLLSVGERLELTFGRVGSIHLRLQLNYNF